jgi:hypothetical protein
MLSARYWKLLCSLLLLFSSVSTVLAQRGVPHYQHAGALPPGYVGTMQAQRGGPLPGYFQPLELRGPEGSNISLSVENQFSKPLGSTVKAGMLIGSVYRFKVTNIGQNPGAEVYPTIEVINRLYPPRGQEFQFPIVAEFNLEDLQFALSGKMVTRVIYLENPNAAFPMAIKEQTYFEVKPGEDPLAVADRLGRPMAILRIGSRIPDDRNGPDVKFMYGSPAMLVQRGIMEQIYPQGLPLSSNITLDETR